MQPQFAWCRQWANLLKTFQTKNNKIPDSDSFHYQKFLIRVSAFHFPCIHSKPLHRKSIPHIAVDGTTTATRGTGMMNMEIFMVCTQEKERRKKKPKPQQQPSKRSIFIDTGAQARFNEPARKR